MKPDATLNSISAPPLPQPGDLVAEGARARKLASELDGVKTLVEGTRLINDTVLVQVLFALWDSGFYEYALSHLAFGIEQAAVNLRFDEKILEYLLEYLTGRGIVRSNDGKFELTDHGKRLFNVALRGTMNLYIGGYGQLLSNIGPLLRKELPQADFNELRSARHTVNGTEQLISIRTAQAVLQILRHRSAKGVVQLACRTGEFLIELARCEPTLHGMGVDKLSDRIAAARTKAELYGIDHRMRFVTGEVGRDPLPIDQSSIPIDVITAIYFLHEVGRRGRDKIVDLLRQVRAAYPGRLFIFAETMPVASGPPLRKPPTTFSQFDYLLIHRLRGQGLPLSPAQWQSIIEEAGLKFLEMRDVYGSVLYLAEM